MGRPTVRALTLRDAAFLGSLNKFSPLSLSPSAWYDASDSSTVIASGSPLRVSQWSDKSSNARHLTQTTSTLQPATGVTTLNNLNCLDFDGNRKLVRLNANLFSNQSGASIFVVVSTDMSVLGNKSFFQVRTPSDVARAQVIGVQHFVQAGGRRLDSDSYQSVNTAGIANISPFLASGFFDWAQARLWAGLNNFLTERSGGFQTVGTTSATDDDMSVGQNARNSGSPLTGSIGEIIVFQRLLTDGEQSDISYYLKSKWGTP